MLNNMTDEQKDMLRLIFECSRINIVTQEEYYRLKLLQIRDNFWSKKKDRNSGRLGRD